MTPERFHQITSCYPRLRAVVLGDFCLDRYLEIDPERKEVSIETGLPVHNVVRTRAQPGAAGTILNNLVALGLGTIYPVGFAGEDGEGFELGNSLEGLAGVRMDCFLRTPQRRTFTYCKPLVLKPGHPPQELNRLDSKNWTVTPPEIQRELSHRFLEAARDADCVIVLDQVDIAQTGVITGETLSAMADLQKQRPDLLILADSRRGLSGFPPVTFKMNAAELGASLGQEAPRDLESIRGAALEIAHRNQRKVFITLSERGILGATPEGLVEHVPALPVRGEIDIVGAGDAVSANLAAAFAGGASLTEGLELATAAASVVIHKLGTTGTAMTQELKTEFGWQ
jgi:rfaE bifunctional protein kinase chain/domain